MKPNKNVESLYNNSENNFFHPITRLEDHDCLIDFESSDWSEGPIEFLPRYPSVRPSWIECSIV